MRKLLVGLVIAGMLLVAADRAALALAENRLASRIDSKQGVSGSQVAIAGFPFLTQVKRNHFDKIEVSLPTLSSGSDSGSLRVEQLQVTLHDVSTAGDYSRATAASVTGSGTVKYDTFAGGLLAISYGGTSPDGTGLLDITVPGLGQSIQVAPDLADGQTLELGALGSGLPAVVSSFIQQRYGFAGLPSGVKVVAVRATPDGLEVTVSGTDVDFAD